MATDADLCAAWGLVSDWELRSCSTHTRHWPGPTTIHFSSYYISCPDLLSSDAAARRRLPWYLEESACGTPAHESSFGTHTAMRRWWPAMHHWRWWHASSQQLNRHVFDFLATSFKLWQIMLHSSCIAFYRCSACVHICFAARCLPITSLWSWHPWRSLPVSSIFLCQLRPNVGRSACMAPFTTVNRNSIASTLALRPGPYPRISSSLCVCRRFVRASFDTMLVSFPTEFQVGKNALASSFTWLCASSCAKQSDLWLSITQLAGGSTWIASFCVTVHVFLYQAERPMVACHLGGRGCGMTRSCVLGPALGFQPSMTARAMG